MADADIEPQGIELSDRPKGVEVDLRAQNDVLLLVGGNRDRRETRCGVRKRKRVVFGEVDIVVVLDAHRRAETELDGADFQIVRELIDRLTARFSGRFTRERGADCILRPNDSTKANQRNKQSDGESASERRRRSGVTHVGVGPVD